MFEKTSFAILCWYQRVNISRYQRERKARSTCRDTHVHEKTTEGSEENALTCSLKKIKFCFLLCCSRHLRSQKKFPPSKIISWNSAEWEGNPLANEIRRNIAPDFPKAKFPHSFHWMDFPHKIKYWMKELRRKHSKSHSTSMILPASKAFLKPLKIESNLLLKQYAQYANWKVWTTFNESFSDGSFVLSQILQE